VTASPHDFTLDAFIGGSGGSDGSARNGGPRGPELRAVHPQRRTLVVVGHLPVMSGLWISQFADREAREGGAVCLVRLEHDAVQLELFRAGGRRPSVSPQASIAEAVRAIAPVASRWMIVPRGNGEASIPAGVTDIVVLTGADDVAIVAAYELVRDHHARAAGCAGSPLPISVAVLGADDEAFANASARLKAAALRFLGCELEVVGGLQRVAPVDSTFRGTFNAPAPTLAEVDAMLDSIQRAATSTRPAHFTTASLRPALATPASVAAQSGVRERFAPNGERRGPRARQQDGETSIPFKAALAPTPPVGVVSRRRPVQVARPGDDEPARPASRRRAFDMPEEVRPSPEEVRLSIGEAPTSPEDLDALRAELARASADLHAQRRSRESVAPDAAESLRRVASLAPSPSVVGRATVVEGIDASELADRFIELSERLRRFRFQAPGAPEIALGIDDDGRMHLVGRATDLVAIGGVRKWLRENDAMIRTVETSYTSVEPPVVDIVFPSLAEALPIDGVFRHVVQLVEVAGRRGLLVQTLDA
jgi:hypothetical protein